MRVVLDTNVLVAGVLSPSGPPGWIVEATLSGDLQAVFDAAIWAEYTEALRRPELSLAPARVRVLLEALDQFGLEIVAAPWPRDLPDRDDAPFLEVAFAVGCPLVTGNLRHFPASARAGVKVLSPREFLAFFSRGRRERR